MSKIDLNKAGILAGFSLLLLLLVLIGVVLVLTVVFWLPIVLFNIPFIIIFGILAKYTIVNHPFSLKNYLKIGFFRTRWASPSKQCIIIYMIGYSTRARRPEGCCGSICTTVYAGYTHKLVGKS